MGFSPPILQRKEHDERSIIYFLKPVKMNSYLVKSMTDTLLDSAQSWRLDDIEKLQNRLEDLWDEIKLDTCEGCGARRNEYRHECSGDAICKECEDSPNNQEAIDTIHNI